MHVRRALLLFAIVLGVAALAASISVEPERRTTAPPPTTTPAGPAEARPGTAPVAPAADAAVVFPPPKGRRTPTRKLEVGRAAMVAVTVTRPGQVDIPQLGLTDAAEPDSPAEFQVLLQRAGRVPIVYTPAEGSEARRVGTLVGAAR